MLHSWLTWTIVNLQQYHSGSLYLANIRFLPSCSYERLSSMTSYATSESRSKSSVLAYTLKWSWYITYLSTRWPKHLQQCPSSWFIIHQWSQLLQHYVIPCKHLPLSWHPLGQLLLGYRTCTARYFPFSLWHAKVSKTLIFSSFIFCLNFSFIIFTKTRFKKLIKLSCQISYTLFTFQLPPLFSDYKAYALNFDNWC